jgi:hypothetical protein
MGLFNMFSSESNAEDNRIAATDQAHVTRGSNNISGQDSSRVVGTRGTLAESGGVSLGQGAKLNAGLDLTGAKTGNVTINDVGAYQSMVSTFADALNQSQQTLADALQSQSGTVQSAVDATSGGTGTSNKTVLYVVLGVLALLGWLFLKK